jgi:hypothetical protein
VLKDTGSMPGAFLRKNKNAARDEHNSGVAPRVRTTTARPSYGAPLGMTIERERPRRVNILDSSAIILPQIARDARG